MGKEGGVESIVFLTKGREEGNRSPWVSALHSSPLLQKSHLVRMKKKLHITALSIVGFKRIEAFSLDPETGKEIVLTGDNAMGKSSVLDAILFGLKGKGADRPLHDGMEKGEIEMVIEGDLRRFEITRTFNADKKHLKVEDKEGRPVPSPQKFLDGLVGAIAFDPEKFVTMPPKDRAEALRLAAGLDFDELDKERANAFEERRIWNRQLEKAETEKSALGARPSNPGKLVVVAEIVGQRDALLKIRSDYRDAEDDEHHVNRDLSTQASLVEGLKEDLEEAIKEHGKLEKAAGDAADKVASLTPPFVEAKEQLPELEESLAGAEEHNDVVRFYERDKESREALTAKVKEFKRNAYDYDQTIKRVDAEKLALVGNSKLPEGMGFTEEGEVTHQGVPFTDLNTSKQWEIATQLAVLQDPELGVVFMREAALMNTAAKEYVYKWARARDIQLWVEQFQEEHGEEGIHIEDGTIAFVDGKKV